MPRFLSLFIALRYIRAKRRTQVISFISFVSILAIGLGVAVMVTVMSVMNGFEKELRRGILSMVEHVSFFADDHNKIPWETLTLDLENRPGVASVAPAIDGAGMVGQGRGMGINIRGVYPQKQVKISNIAERIIQGSFSDLKPGTIVIGKVLADKVNSQIGDKITILTSQNTFRKSSLLPKIRRFTIVGIFEAGVHLYNERFTFVHYDDAAEMLLGASGRSGLQINTLDPYYAPILADQLHEQYGADFSIRDWTWKYRNLFRAIKQQKGMMFIILSLIVAVAALSIVTTLIMMVTDKSAEIAILRTIGATPSMILRIFIIQGFVIGVVGILFGLLVGIVISDNIAVIISALEGIVGMQLLPSEVYYISQLTGDRQWEDIMKITGSAFIICLLATVYPAWKAATTKPASALKFE